MGFAAHQLSKSLLGLLVSDSHNRIHLQGFVLGCPVEAKPPEAFSVIERVDLAGSFVPAQTFESDLRFSRECSNRWSKCRGHRPHLARNWPATACPKRFTHLRSVPVAAQNLQTAPLRPRSYPALRAVLATVSAEIAWLLSLSDFLSRVHRRSGGGLSGARSTFQSCVSGRNPSASIAMSSLCASRASVRASPRRRYGSTPVKSRRTSPISTATTP